MTAYLLSPLTEYRRYKQNLISLWILASITHIPPDSNGINLGKEGYKKFDDEANIQDNPSIA